VTHSAGKKWSESIMASWYYLRGLQQLWVLYWLAPTKDRGDGRQQRATEVLPNPIQPQMRVSASSGLKLTEAPGHRSGRSRNVGPFQGGRG